MKYKYINYLIVIVCAVLMMGCPAKDRTSSPQVQTYTLTVNINPVGAGTVSISPQKSSYSAGEVVTLIATASSGYTFTGWTGDVTGTNAQITVTMNSNKTVTANFTQSGGGGSGGGTTNYTLTVVVNPTNAGQVTLSPSGGTYASGTQVTLVATANSGYTFSNWSGDLTGTTNPATITMNANKVVVANFTQSGGDGGGGTTNYYTLTVTVNPTGAGTVSLNPSGGSYTAGTVVVLTAQPNSGYKFSQWTGDVTGNSNPTTVTMNANKSVTAVFTQSGGGGGGTTKVVFADSGAAGFVGAFSGGGGTIYLEADNTVFHEGASSLKATVSVPNGGWAGWYVEEGGAGGTETADMSAFANGYLVFWAKSEVVLEVSIYSYNLNPDNAGSKILLTGANAYGFAADNQWHQVSIPLSAFKTKEPNLDFSQINTYFSIAVIVDTGGTKTFWIDDVKWTSQ